MISSDKNIETIAQLAESLKHYVGVQSEYVKLDIIEKVVRLLTLTAMALVVVLALMLMLIYLSFAAAYALAPLTGMVGAFCIVAGVYLLLLILFVINRRKWVEKPLVKFLADLLLNS
ncbi:MAG: phage holin family protein [Prevotella sp.]|nr:phage holin family protein [Prevotella sp.]